MESSTSQMVCAQEKLDRSRDYVSRTWEEIFRMSPRMGSR